MEDRNLQRLGKVIRIYKTVNFKNGIYFGHFYIWDQFWATSAIAEAISLPKMVIKVSKGELA